MTYCDLNDLRCGQTYNVSVFGLDDTCSSVESMKSQMRTAPCAPQDVDVTSMCADGAITVSWAPNPDAQYFHVSAVSSTMMKQYCNSTSTNCTLSNLPCGQYYNVTVQSVRDNCESKPSAVIETCTAPCLPEDVTGRLDCVTNAAWVTWEEAEGVSSYIVLAHEDGGHNYTCTTSSSPCNIPDLKCGTTYTIYVSTVNKHCYSNSSNSTTFELVTGPCTLTAIDVETECYSDTLYVEWEAAEDTPIYLVTAEGHDQSLLSCNSSGSSCEIYGARCGMYYSVIVSAASDKCSSLRSPPKKIKTAPCVPDNVTVVPSCDDNGAMITWGHSHVATSYMVTATGRDGHVLNYNTSVNNFSLSDLHCGQPYSLTISARGDNCTSPPWMTSFTSVPCEPSGLQVDIDCETNSAALSWDPSEGTMEYYGCAKSMDGDMIYCNSTVASCMIEGLECGEVYNFSVEAFDGFCNSSFSAPLQEGAAPCPPADLNVRLQKIGRNHWVLASWDMVDCPGVEYLVEVMGQIQNNPQALIEVSSYWLSRTFFELPLPCSTAYSLTVRSRNAAGISEPSDAFNGITAPCAPQNVKYTGNSQSAVLSWDASVFATSYTVYNGSGEDRVKLCETADLSCQLTNFEPNATEVTASNAEGESNPNGDVTGPGSRRRRDLRRNLIMFHKTDKNLEMPQVLSIRMRGLSLYVKWKSVTGASSYTLLIEERKSKERANHTPEVIIVESDVNFHIEKNLRPWTTYCIRLAAKSILNQSFYSFPVCKTTKGP
ncbi:fibronectin type III domain-containing protein 7-like [Antennarius striatus]|uniref:fibronectin type III domain-containing protein 7-like n=1 Tax=Antennarius striatus TaxID=241820 RepID=UPI0035B03E8E